MLVMVLAIVVVVGVVLASAVAALGVIARFADCRTLFAGSNSSWSRPSGPPVLANSEARCRAPPTNAPCRIYSDSCVA